MAIDMPKRKRAAPAPVNATIDRLEALAKSLQAAPTAQLQAALDAANAEVRRLSSIVSSIRMLVANDSAQSAVPKDKLPAEVQAMLARSSSPIDIPEEPDPEFISPSDNLGPGRWA